MLARVPLLIAIMFGIAVAHGAPVDPAIVAENTSPIELAPETVQFSLFIKIVGEGQLDKSTTPRVDAVMFGATPLASSRFAASWATNPTAQSIDVKLDRPQFDKAGTYDLYLEIPLLTGVGTDKRNLMARLKCQVVLVAPKLAPVAKLIVNRTRYFGWCEHRPKLTLEEVTQASNLTVTHVGQSGQPTVGNETTTGELSFQFPTTQPVVLAGKTLEIPYTLLGDFPLGNATMSVRITAKELREPAATIEYEIRSRLHPLWIEVPVILGLLVSYFIKVWLQSRIDRSEATVSALELLTRIRSDEPKHRDQTFRSAYRSELTALDEAVSKSFPTVAINLAKKNLDDKWRAALQDLAARRQSQQDDLTKLRDVTDYVRPVPSSVQQAIRRARAAEQDVVAAITDDDVDGAKHLRTQIAIDLGDAVKVAAVVWQEETKQVFQMLLAVAPAGLSKYASGPFISPAQSTIVALNRIAATDLLDSLGKIQQALNDAGAEMSLVQQVLRNLYGTLQLELDAAGQLLDHPPEGWDTAAFEEVTKATVEFQETLRKMSDVPDPQAAQAGLNGIHRAWTNGLQKQLDESDGRVDRALAENDYLGALAIAIEIKAPHVKAIRLEVDEHTTRAEMENSTGSRRAWILMAPDFVSPIASGTMSTHVVRTVFQADAIPSPVPATVAVAMSQLFKQKSMMSVILAMLVGIGA
jgi:hypothetical protein